MKTEQTTSFDINATESPIGNLYKTEEVAAFLKISPRSLQRYIRSGELRAFWIGGGYRISQEDLKRFIASRMGVTFQRGPKPKGRKRR